MRAVGLIVMLLLGLALVAGLQWAAGGAPGLPAAVPAWLPGAAPLIVAAIFGLYLALGYGGTPRTALAVCGALVALAVAGLPFAYTFGLAQAHGLPASGGAIGTWLAGPEARNAAAVWFLVAVVGALRRPRAAAVRPVPAAPEAPGEPFWTPAPALHPSAGNPVAYSPTDSDRT